MSLLTLKGVDLDIHETPVLRDVSLSVDAGETLGIIGESGSGKSMTAYSILRLLPDGAKLSGEITLDGEDLANLDENQMCARRGRKIGMVFQEPMTALNPLMTIGDQVAEAIHIHSDGSYADARAEARRTMDRVELPADRFPMDLYPHQLSGGQRQRVVIAMAIAQRPALLIADEPTTALDVTTQARILRLIKRLVADDGMALLMITHDLAVIAEMSDSIAIMQKGRIVEQGQTQEVLAGIRHAYTKSLFEASGHTPTRDHSGKEDNILLSVRNVSRSYPLPRRSLLKPAERFMAVRDVSFDVRHGESMGLVGESGCGKSTLARAILGLEQVQAGTIEVDSTPVWSERGVDREVRRKMQVVFQDPYGSFNPRHRVDRLITEPFHLLDKPPTGDTRDEAISQALESVGLDDDARKRYIHEFSGGQRQRLAIARALIIRPKLIVLDEAVSALDVSIRAQILDLLADLSGRFGLTYLFISHDLSVVRAITDRVLVMQAGEIVEHGPTSRVLDAPTHPYTQKLISAVPRLPAYKAA